MSTLKTLTKGLGVAGILGTAVGTSAQSINLDVQLQQLEKQHVTELLEKELELTTKQEQLDTANASLKDMEEVVVSTDKDLQEQEKINQDQDKEIVTLKEEKQGLLRDKARVEAEKKGLDDRLTKTQRDLANAYVDKAKLEQKIERQTKDYDQLETQLHDSQRELQEVKEELDATKQKIEEQEENFNREKTKLKDDYDQLQTKLGKFALDKTNNERIVGALNTKLERENKIKQTELVEVQKALAGYIELLLEIETAIELEDDQTEQRRGDVLSKIRDIK